MTYYLFYSLLLSKQSKCQSTPTNGKHKVKIVAFKKYYGINWSTHQRDEILKEVTAVNQRKDENWRATYLRECL